MSDVRVLLLLILALLALLFPLVALLVRLTRSMWRVTHTSYQVTRGRYAHARVYLEHAVRRRAAWFGFHPDLQRRCAFDLAACDFEDGRLEEAVARLRAIRTRHHVFADAIEAMAGAALLLGDKDPSAARQHLERIVDRRGSENIVLLLSHALLSDGDEEAARAMFATVDDERAKVPRALAWGAFVRFDGLIRARFTEAFLRGWFFLRTGDPERAMPLFAHAAECPVGNRFSSMAAHFLAEAGGGGPPVAPQ
jgi:hypothetical protein